MKHIYLSFVLLLVCATNLYAQHFIYSLELIGTNATTGNYEVALIATPDFTNDNGNSADMGTIISMSQNIFVTDAGFVNECTTSTTPPFATTCQYAITADEWSLEYIAAFSEATERNVFAFIRTETGVSTFFDVEAGVPIILAVFQIFNAMEGEGLPTTGDLFMLENDSELVANSFYDGGWLNIAFDGEQSVDLYGGNDPDASSINFGSLSTPDLQIKQLSIYPNPATHTVEIKGVENNLQAIEIYSITGQRITDFTTDLKTINVQALQSGVYLVRLISEGASKTVKLVKI